MTGELPNRTPGASGYQQWMAGDVYQRVVFMPGPAKYSDPKDPAVRQHVLEVLERPHIRTVLNHRTDGGGTRRRSGSPTQVAALRGKESMSVTATKEEGDSGMTTASSTQGFVNDPVVSISGQIALARPDDVVCGDQPSSDDVRPWNLRRMGPLMTSDGRWSSVSYDHEQQIAVTETGQPVLDRRCRTAGPVAGPPTAPTTPPVDGEDPPSSEDWINDFAPEEPSPV